VDVLDVKASAGPELWSPAISLKLYEPLNTRLSRLDPCSATGQLTRQSITVNGDSMDGTISWRSDLRDTGVTHFDGDGVYVFVFGKTLHVKRLQMQRDRLAVISDNPIYEKWYVEAGDEDTFYVMARYCLDSLSITKDLHKYYSHSNYSGTGR
jgi:hypothetical protein